MKTSETNYLFFLLCCILYTMTDNVFWAITAMIWGFLAVLSLFLVTGGEDGG